MQFSKEQIANVRNTNSVSRRKTLKSDIFPHLIKKGEKPMAVVMIIAYILTKEWLLN